MDQSLRPEEGGSGWRLLGRLSPAPCCHLPWTSWGRRWPAMLHQGAPPWCCRRTSPTPRPCRSWPVSPLPSAWLAGTAKDGCGFGQPQTNYGITMGNQGGRRLALVQGTMGRAGGPQGVLALRGHLTSPGHPNLSICKDASHTTSQSWGWLHSRAS